MKRLPLYSVLGLFLFVILLLTSQNGLARDTSQYGLGGIVDSPLPEWIHPSPLMDRPLDLDELDESCDNSAGLPPVGNQSSQNSCSGWGTGYYYLTYLQGQEFGWDLTDPEHIMSPAFVYNTINGGEDAGATPYDGFEVFERLGCGTLADMPYSASDYLSFPSEETFQEAMTYRINETFSLNIFTQTGRNALKQHLLDGNIAVIHIYVYQNFMDIEDFNNTYCIADHYGSLLGGHVVTVVGFDDEYVTADGVGAFKLVNSWGTGWGDAGFWWMSYEAIASSTMNSGFAIYAEDKIDYEPTLAARVEISHGDRYQLVHTVGIGNAWNPDHAIDFYDWGYYRETCRAYPDDAVLLLDITDLHEYIAEEGSNELFFSTEDFRANAITGTIDDFQVIDFTNGHYAVCPSTPVGIPDIAVPGIADLVFRYEAVPPENVNATLDPVNGTVFVEWDPITTTGDFLGYTVFANDEQLGTTEADTITVELPDYGEYEITVKSYWTDTFSYPSDAVTVNWYEGEAVRFFHAELTDQSTGTVQLEWWQLCNDQDMALDDGSAESSLGPSGSMDTFSIARRFEIPEDGIATAVGAYFNDDEDIESAEIRFKLCLDNDNLPGDELFTSETLGLDAAGWLWFELPDIIEELEAGSVAWAAVDWVNMEGASLGRDQDGAQEPGWAISSEVGSWTYMSFGGNPMIRIRTAEQEVIDGPTFLQRFTLTMNDEYLAEITDDTRTYQVTLPEYGEFEFVVHTWYPHTGYSCDPVTVVWSNQAVAESELPCEYTISNPYPNPFNPETSLKVELPVASNVRIAVYNTLGQQVAVLRDGVMNPGSHSVLFNGSDFASGMYFIRTSIPGYLEQVNKVILIK